MAHYKEILNNIEAAVLRRWGDVDLCPNIDEIKTAADGIRRTKRSIKNLKSQIKNLSKKSKNGDSVGNAFKMQIRESADKVKAAEKELKLNIHRLESLFTAECSLQAIPQKFQTTRAPRSASSGDANLLRIVTIDSEFRAAWDTYVQSHPRSSIYHMYGWRTLLESVHKVKGIYLAAFDVNKNIVGVLPSFNLRSSLFGNYLVSLPYFNYGGPLADFEEIEMALVDHAAAISRSSNFAHFEVRATHPINKWPQKQDKVSMLLHLPETISELNNYLGAKVRAQIKQARNHGLQTQLGGRELVDDFYDVFARNMRDLGTPVYSKKFFEAIAEYFSGVCTIIVVRLQNKPIAAGFLLAHHEILEIPWASSLRSYNHLNANMLMYAEVLNCAIDKGYDFFDFGRSSIDSPTFRFKKQWGAKPCQHYWHYWLPEGDAVPDINPSNPKYRLAISLWKKMPVWLTKIVGPRIVAYLP